MYTPKALLSMAVLLGVSMAQQTTDQTTAQGTGSGNPHDASCTRSYVRILAGAPTPTGQLASAITSYAGGFRQTGSPNSNNNNNANPVSEACSFSSNLPSSLQRDFDAYLTSVISYVSASSSEIDALITNCVASGSQGASLTSIVNSVATHSGPLCQATGAANGTSTSTTSSATTPTSSTTRGGGGGGGGTRTGGPTSAGTTSAQTGAGAKPTGMFAGAAAAAGVLGAAVLL
ncbi:hypothetical protein GGR50DRAFT_696871 [Xylaria sp. CBS 124048]|nr:hypothetical protein GGR50DRAFT_696871 [Xylaria sp. CBS 124048]